LAERADIIAANPSGKRDKPGIYKRSGVDYFGYLL
jgi:hypothetical protein